MKTLVHLSVTFITILTSCQAAVPSEQTSANSSVPISTLVSSSTPTSTIVVASPPSSARTMTSSSSASYITSEGSTVNTGIPMSTATSEFPAGPHQNECPTPSNGQTGIKYCSTDRSSLCYKSTDGTNYCVDDDYCSNLQACSSGSCPAGTVCVINTPCPQGNVCAYRTKPKAVATVATAADAQAAVAKFKRHVLRVEQSLGRNKLSG